MVDLIQILLRDSLAFVFRYAAVAGQARAQQHLLNWGSLSYLRKTAFQIIHIYRSRTKWVFVHSPSPNTHHVQNKMSVCSFTLPQNKHKHKQNNRCEPQFFRLQLRHIKGAMRNSLPLHLQHLSLAVSLYFHHFFSCCTKRWNR